MNNPCEQCVVKAMCRDGCFRLIEYLETNQVESLDGGSDPLIPMDVIAFGLRNGMVSLCEDETKWRWGDNWPIHVKNA